MMGLSTHALVAGVPRNLLEELSPNKMKWSLVKTAIFTDFGPVVAIQVKIGQWQIKRFYIAKYSTAEGSVVQHFRAMDRETNSVDPAHISSCCQNAITFYITQERRLINNVNITANFSQLYNLIFVAAGQLSM